MSAVWPTKWQRRAYSGRSAAGRAHGDGCLQTMEPRYRPAEPDKLLCPCKLPGCSLEVGCAVLIPDLQAN